MRKKVIYHTIVKLLCFIKVFGVISFGVYAYFLCSHSAFSVPQYHSRRTTLRLVIFILAIKKKKKKEGKINFP